MNTFKHLYLFYSGRSTDTFDKMKTVSFSSEPNDSLDYLRTLNTVWNDHMIRSVCIEFLRKISSYTYGLQSLIRQLFIVLDRTYVLHAAVPSIWELNQDLFRRHIMQNLKISNRSVKRFYMPSFELFFRVFRCINGLLKLIEQERRGETVDRSLIKSLIRMLIDLHVRLYYTPKNRYLLILLLAVVSKRL